MTSIGQRAGAPNMSLSAIEGIVFDLDGVVTDTAAVHRAAWRQTFDAYLRERARREGAEDAQRFAPFSDEDYRRWVDGKPRYHGVNSFLTARGIELPWGRPDDDAGAETVCGIGNRKNEEFGVLIGEGGVRAFPTTVDLLGALRARGTPVAIISASRNCEAVLRSVGLLEAFDARVDGVEADRLGLPGKPDPAVFLEAARRIGSPPRRAAVIEDAIAGVEAGRGGGFGLVIGVAREDNADELERAGADRVVADLGELLQEVGDDG